MNKKIKIVICLLILIGSIVLLFTLKKESNTNELNIYSWEGYIPENIIQNFENKNNAEINIYEYNDEIFAKNEITNNPEKYDLIIVSDVIIKELIEEEKLEKITKSNIQNLENINPFFLNRNFDKSNKYSVPYMWGTTGIIYNKNKINEINLSWSVLWNENYKDKIGLMSDLNELIFSTCKYTGINYPPEAASDFNKIEDFLFFQKRLIKNYESPEIISQKLVDEKIYIAQIYSDNANLAIKENANLSYITPKEGASVWVDNMAILKNSKNKKLAEQFINYILIPEVSKNISEQLLVFNCNDEATKLLSKEFYEKSSQNLVNLQKLNFLSEKNETESFRIFKKTLWEKLNIGELELQ